MSFNICCVPDCFVKLGCGIAFHRFPNPSTDIDRFEAWTSQIGGEVTCLDHNFVYKNRRICNKHFASFYHGIKNRLTANAIPSVEIPGPIIKDESDIDNTAEVKGIDHENCNQLHSNDDDEENSLKKIMLNSRSEKQKQSNNQELEGSRNKPNILHVACAVVVKTEDLDVPAMFRVCRICLAIDVKMYRISDCRLSRAYQLVTGILVDPDDQLPKALCWECCGRLLSAQRFRDKAVAANRLMVDKCSNAPISIRDVKSIDRCCNNLESTLNIQHLNDHSDVTVHADGVGKQEEESVKCDGDDEPEDLVLEVDRDKILVTICTDLATRVPSENRANRRKRNNEKILLKESNRGALKQKNKKNIKKSDKVLLKDVKPSATEDRYKQRVSRRRQAAALDESLFTVSRPTYAEQVAEVQRRGELLSYKLAPYQCAACCRGFRTRDSYDNHALKHSESSGPYECFICKARFVAPSPLRDHMTRQHSEKYSCNRCPFSTSTRHVARRHQNYHAGVKHQCPHCHKEFGKVSTYMSHLRIKHPSRFVCELCGYAFLNQWGVDVHKRKKHARLDVTKPLEGPYCGECDIRFLSEEAYSRHLKLSAQHSTEGDPGRIRNDSQCGAGRGGRGGTRPQHSGPVSCEECGVELRSMRQYALHHRRQHANARTRPAPPPRLMCDQCGKTFQSSVHLASHMWVHTGVKRFQCGECAKSFTSKASLALHVAAHGGARPTHDCPVCGRQFTFRTNRRRHMLIHTGLKPFKCETCGKCFKTEAERRSHVDHVHLKVPWPKRTRTHVPRAADNTVTDT